MFMCGMAVSLREGHAHLLLSKSLKAHPVQLALVNSQDYVGASKGPVRSRFPSSAPTALCVDIEQDSAPMMCCGEVFVVAGPKS